MRARRGAARRSADSVRSLVAGRLLDRLRHLEDLEAFPVGVGEAAGDAVGAHGLELHGVVDDLLFGGGRGALEAGEGLKQPANGPGRNAQGAEEDLGAAPVAHPRDPLLLTRENRQEKEKVLVQAGPPSRNRLRG